jgi:hypothetical protein
MDTPNHHAGRRHWSGRRPRSFIASEAVSDSDARRPLCCRVAIGVATAHVLTSPMLLRAAGRRSAPSVETAARRYAVAPPPRACARQIRTCSLAPASKGLSVGQRSTHAARETMRDSSSLGWRTRCSPGTSGPRTRGDPGTSNGHGVVAQWPDLPVTKTRPGSPYLKGALGQRPCRSAKARAPTWRYGTGAARSRRAPSRPSSRSNNMLTTIWQIATTGALGNDLVVTSTPGATPRKPKKVAPSNNYPQWGTRHPRATPRTRDEGIVESIFWVASGRQG